MNEAIDLNSLKKLSTVITDRLAEQVQSGMLKPGERLVQMDLAKRFNVSRVAVRDALMDLRRRGLSVNIPHKGDIVRPVSCQIVRDLFEVRKINESHAVKTACIRIDARGIARLEKIITEQETCIKNEDVAAFIAKDWEFHDTIFGYCGNEPLRELIEGLWARTRQARSVAQNDLSWGKHWGRSSILRHRELLAAIEARNAELAAEITKRIITEASDELVGELSAVGWDAGCSELPPGPAPRSEPV
jgi:DNA-binding GntR family transcriptional regulator